MHTQVRNSGADWHLLRNEECTHGHTHWPPSQAHASHTVAQTVSCRRAHYSQFRTCAHACTVITEVPPHICAYMTGTHTFNHSHKQSHSH